MKDKIVKVLGKTYGGIMFVSFFAGVLPLIPFVLAIIIGGNFAEIVCSFIYNKYYPIVISGSSIAVVVGTIALYITGEFKKKSKNEKKEDQSMEENK